MMTELQMLNLYQVAKLFSCIFVGRTLENIEAFSILSSFEVSCEMSEFLERHLTSMRIQMFRVLEVSTFIIQFFLKKN